MKDKINIGELLKDCPQGMELYSPLCGECVFDRLDCGTIICKKQNTQEITFTSEGYYMLPVFDNCECMIFPSKDQRDWSKFQRPFKDGDILFVDCSDEEEEDKSYLYIFILNKPELYGSEWHSYCHLDGVENLYLRENYLAGECYRPRFATKEEKQQLFDAIKANGYKWNEETKTLEKLTEQKFDITTLKPFDKVLVRDFGCNAWSISFFSHCNELKYCKYICISGVYSQCIPYNDDTKHLFGTTDDCDEFYKTWE